VNRCLTEGRRRFLERFDHLSAGAGCEELQPLLSLASDGECSAPARARLQIHLDGCATCRATLRGYREAPARLAELLPPALLLPVLERPAWWSRLTGWLETGPVERAAGLAQKLHGNAELVSAKKAAAVMASTAVVAGGAAVEHRASHPRAKPERETAARSERPRTAQATTASAPAVTVATAAAAARRTGARTTARKPRAPVRRDEFGFESAGSAAQEGPGSREATAAAASTSAGDAASEFGGPGASGGASAVGGEFGP
jgi:hypothetical protein